MTCGPLPLRTDELVIPTRRDFGWYWDVFDLSGAAVDITGWTATMTIRARSDAPDPALATFTTDLGDGITTSGNRLTLIITAEDSADWSWLKSVFDIELSSVDPAAGPFYFTSGTIRTVAPVTR